ncbi:hypothetical protein M8Z33_42110 [Streptomyces sp. ZAF1911]|uniref:hypothetical protein n=1 Tax=Streptomyces sp. ZAF1911 TaxID=2944129 RepID=UPI00237C3F62|nr:hypothetical protein [Streptomyces sp. ZAF1911]MDD9383134.1 hypothetical protein [Streptomyces sp. ZAF1911]
MEHEKSLTTTQGIILGAAALPMLGVGGLGAWGTFTNIKTQFPQDATALGVVAAGEGATLVLALVMVGLTLLSQSSPTVVRLGLWLLPAVASGTGVVVADGTKEAVVYAITPMAMCASAEGIGLLARRIVIYTTGVDMEARRRNAITMRRMAVLRARAANHPWKRARRLAELASWRLARKVGVGDDELGADLVQVQRDRLTVGANQALGQMFTTTAVTPALPASVTPALEPVAGQGSSVTPAVPETVTRHDAVMVGAAAVTTAGTQVSTPAGPPPSQHAVTVAHPSRDGVTGRGEQAVTDSVTDTGSVTEASVTEEEPSRSPVTAMSLEQVAAVAGVPVPRPGERLSDAQLLVVLRHLCYREDPPLSYRAAVHAFRQAGFVAGEERIRVTWRELPRDVAGAADADEPEPSHARGDGGTEEEDEEEAGPRP